ncbi:hypothetical protein HPP92_022161 [Vanilla planifolia]|uniref:ARC6 IMS domain-containing protein n=1 Tax=Vanilla planifolia TaxID=51239 RepID=A0A835PXP5_VANPL|nr:hypothetical protein HPP92_022161 [Vanilla planifolia]
MGEIDECQLWLGIADDSSAYRNPDIIDFIMENSKGCKDAAAAIAKIGAEATAALGNAKSNVLYALGKLGNEVASQKPISEYSSEQDVTNMIKEASVMILCAGIAVSVLTLAALRYLPGKNAPPVSIKESGSAMTANAVNIATTEKVDKEFPKMDAKLAENLVRKWQQVKSRALGSNHQVEELAEVLDGRMLQIWMDRAKEVARHGSFWEYTLLGLTIDSVTISFDGRRATVEATIDEVGKLIDMNHPEANDSYDAKYTARYDMTCLESSWKITEGAVLKT